MVDRAGVAPGVKLRARAGFGVFQEEDGNDDEDEWLDPEDNEDDDVATMATDDGTAASATLHSRLHHVLVIDETTNSLVAHSRYPART